MDFVYSWLLPGGGTLKENAALSPSTPVSVSNKINSEEPYKTPCRLTRSAVRAATIADAAASAAAARRSKGSATKTPVRRSKRKRYQVEAVNFSNMSPDGLHYMKRSRTERIVNGTQTSTSSSISPSSSTTVSTHHAKKEAVPEAKWWTNMSRTDRLRRRRRQIIQAQQSSIREVGSSSCSASSDSSSADSEGETSDISYSGMDNEESDEEVDDDLNDDNPLPHVTDAITLCPILVPTMSPRGHVIGLASWQTSLKATGGRCPFTKQPLSAEALTVLTKTNINRYRSRLIFP
jgi:hypothetical protein